MLSSTIKKAFVLVCVLQLFYQVVGYCQTRPVQEILKQTDKEVAQAMKRGNIPGLSMALIINGHEFIRNYGYADVHDQVKVNSNTLFEIGSCSKAFTALAVAELVNERRINPNAPVTDYLPWFTVQYKGKPARLLVSNLIHHTSGIPWSSISAIKPLSGADALYKTVYAINHQKLDRLPGKKFEYATINYDILALVVQTVSKQPFEAYVQKNVIDKLQLNHTQIGYPVNSKLLAKGYKSGFLMAWPFQPPVFKGNNAAGYVIADIMDMNRWLKLQMGLQPTSLYPDMLLTHQRDETVGLHDMASYAMGWDVLLDGSSEINHDGFNPSFTAYMAFRKPAKTGVVILANASSNFTAYLGSKIIKLAAGDDAAKDYDPGDGGDSGYTIVSLGLALYICANFIYLGYLVIDTRKKNRIYEGFKRSVLASLAKFALILVPFAYAVYLLPVASAGFTWDAIFVWSPYSLPVCLIGLAVAVIISFLSYTLSLLYPSVNKFKGKAPMLVLLGIMAGFANMIVVILITSSLNSTVHLRYLVFYYVLVSLLYLTGRRYVQIQLIKFSRGLTYDLKSQIIDKILNTSYQKFEKIRKGNIYTALNDDVSIIGESTNVFIVLITNLITAIGAFVYLASIAFWATLLTVGLIVAILVIYYFAGNSNNVFFEQARDSQNRFMTLASDMIEGFKELSLKRGKKTEYGNDLQQSAGVYKEKITRASVRFVNVFLIGETLLIVVLGAVAFGFPKFFPSIQVYTISSFVVILLYLIGPINSILNSVPVILQVRVAWNRIKDFIAQIPAAPSVEQTELPARLTVDMMEIRNLSFQYQNDAGMFSVGPVNLEIYKGQIIFIIGGNGSGKTTLAKLITGLYQADSGSVLINGEEVSNTALGEYYSAIFSPAFLFEKMYNINLDGQAEKITEYLELLGLSDKVSISNGRFSTLNLSGGQRKRLALLQCFLEDSPVYLFDEWAADQDPGYRKFFYHTLLPQMRASGKIVIAITHDDQYFDVADCVYKMNQGQMEVYEKERISLI